MDPNAPAPPAPAPPAPAPPPAGRTIAYETYQATVEAKTSLEAKVAELTRQNQGLSEKAATVDTLSAQINEWKGKAEAAEQRFGAHTEFSGALGTGDPEIVAAFDQRYRALPEKDRPSRGDWVNEMKAKPEAAPALLRPWLASGTPAPAAGAGAPKPPAPKVTGNGASPPGGGAKPTEAEVRAVREEAIRTGDWGPWKEMSKRLGLRSK